MADAMMVMHGANLVTVVGSGAGGGRAQHGKGKNGGDKGLHDGLPESKVFQVQHAPV